MLGFFFKKLNKLLFLDAIIIIFGLSLKKNELYLLIKFLANYKV